MASDPLEPIAVVGMSCRFPGGANDPEKLWTLLSDGKSAWQDVPSDRYNWKSFFHPHPGIEGTMSHRGGHFLDQDISAFDPLFFGIQPSEAHAMDPQHRIQLETAYEALESAGIPLDQIRGSDGAVFIATFSKDYDRMIYKDTSSIPRYHMFGNGDAIVSNRISYIFDLKGPSMSLDTGCSGSLVALHQACQSLRTGETSMAFVGGTNLILSPDSMISMSLLGVLNVDGKCYTFDDRGAGYGRGEGVATIILKRLSDALSAGDNVRAIIRGNGVNQDGKTSGISLPSQDAQERLIRSVYSRAGIDLRDVDYVEAHGTGTVAGDTIEINTIANTFGANRDTPLYVSSVKSNLGHSESASGLAGLIKSILILEKGFIPPAVNFQNLKKGLNLAGGRLEIPRTLMPWPRATSERRYASVNNFGYGGTNAHVILEKGPRPTYNRAWMETPAISLRPDGHLMIPPSDQVTACGSEGPSDILKKPDAVTSTCRRQEIHESSDSMATKLIDCQLLVLSAKSRESLVEMKGKLAKWTSDRTMAANELYDLAYTLSSRRSIMDWRCSMVATTRGNTCYFSNDASQMNRASDRVSISFIFTGQGAQWFAMGRELVKIDSVFATSLRTSQEILQSLGAPWMLIEELLRDRSTSRLHESSIAQPATTALQIALVDLLRSFRIEPSQVLGHSSGEIAAGYAVKVLTQTDALRVSFYRGYVVSKLEAGKGAMLAVGLGEVEVFRYTSRVQKGRASIACVNSPHSTTISGDIEAIDELKILLQSDGIQSRLVKVDVAYHSHHMQAIAATYLESLQSIKSNPNATSIEFISSVTGREKKSDFGPAYWVQNLVSKVQYSAAVEQLQKRLKETHSEATMNVLVEIGPHSALRNPTQQIVKHFDDAVSYRCLPSLVREENSVHNIMQLTGKLFELGCFVDIMAANTIGTSLRRRNVIHNLPSYPWDHKGSYWHESRLSKDYRHRRHSYHDLLGLPVVNTGFQTHTWRNMLSLEKVSWLRDHIINEQIVVPGATYICMAMEAMRQVISDHQYSSKSPQLKIYNVVYSKSLIVAEIPGKIEVSTSLASRNQQANDDIRGLRNFSVSSLANDGIWREHCRGTIMVDAESSVDEDRDVHGHSRTAAAQRDTFHEMKERCTEKIDKDQLYDGLKKSGNAYGSTFTILDDFSMCGFEGIARIKTSEAQKGTPTNPNPTHTPLSGKLDALFQISIPLIHKHCPFGNVMPKSVKEITISMDASSKIGKELLLGASLTPEGQRTAVSNVVAFELSDEGELRPAITFSGIELCATGDPSQVAKSSQSGQDMVYRFEWGLDVNFMTSNIFDRKQTRPPSENTDVSFKQKCDDLDHAASIYITICLNRLNEQKWHVSNGHMAHLLNWMQRYVTSEAHRTLLADTDALDLVALVEGIPKRDVEGEALSRVGESLASIIMGEIDPLSLLLEQDLLNRLYLHDESSSRCCSHLVQYLQHLLFKNPYITILEIGAGTGGTTLPLLQSLGNNSHTVMRYDYTDTSSGFFGSAQLLLSEWSEIVRYKTLDIERDPSDQGFEESSYDLIVASNVLHATVCLDETLQNVRKLVKPDGKIALIETTRATPSVGIVAGVLPGWFKGIEDGRKESPLLSPEQWHGRLCKNLFSGIEYAARDSESMAYKTTLMVSRRLEGKESNTKPDVAITVAETTSESCRQLSFELSSNLENKGYRCNFSPLLLQKGSQTSIRVILDSSRKSLLVDPHAGQFQEITKLLTQSSHILWINLQEDNSTDQICNGGLVTGLARVARSENENLNLVTFDVQQFIEMENPKLVQIISEIISGSFNHDNVKDNLELEYIYRDNELLIPRLIPDPGIHSLIKSDIGQPKTEMALFSRPDRPCKLHVGQPGLLDSLVFIDDELTNTPLHPDQLEIGVKACGVNFKDVFIALGQMRAASKMTGECAGVITAVGSSQKARFCIGDRVCGWNGTPYASRARLNGSDACIIPDWMPYTTAASIPVIFMTAYYGLINLANLQRDQTVLIHSATGGVGQAAMMIAQWLGAEVYATAGSAGKRQLIVERFGIPEDHVYSSKTRTFKWAIMRLTQGRGVDVVLNSLSGVALQDSWHLISHFGTFVEIGKTDIYQKAQIDMEPFDRNATFTSVDLFVLATQRPGLLRSTFAKVMSLFEDGILKPVQPINIMAIRDIEDAFRLLQGRKHIGKIVLEAGEETVVKTLSIKSAPVSLDGNATYIVAGGLGSIGQSICRLMASRGAMHLLILSRSAPSAETWRAFEADLASYGANAHLLRCDISNSSMVQGVATYCQTNLPPVKGVIQAAMVLRDRVLEQMSAEDFKTAMQPKYHGTRNLIHAFESRSLDFFVMLSSLSSILGVPSQANYASASAFQDSLAHSRMSCGARYVSFDLGMIDDTETISSHPERRSNLIRAGSIPLILEQALSLLEYLMSAQARQDKCRQLVIGFDKESLVQQQRFRVLQNSLFNHLPDNSRNGNLGTMHQPVKTVDIAMAAATSLDELHHVVAEAVVSQLATLVAVPIEHVALDSPLGNLGIDSLVAIELKNWTVRTFRATVSTSDILDAPSIRDFVRNVAKRSEYTTIDRHVGIRESNLGGIEQVKGDGKQSANGVMEIPKKLKPIPLPSLEETLELYLYSIRSFLSEKEESSTLCAVNQLQEPGGLGQQLQARLIARTNDPQIDYWLHDLQNAYMYLKVRSSANAHRLFFQSHIDGENRHSQAERAAVVSISALQFKRRLGKDGAIPDFMNDQQLCMNTLDWMFNSTRKPHQKIDGIERTPGSDNLIVLRRGHVFEIKVDKDLQGLTCPRLEGVFERILRESENTIPSVASLTAGNRDKLMQDLELLSRISASNELLIERIGAAAFVVCLDDGSPETSSERANQFLLKNIATRWSDKSLEFVVCENGASANVCEHSMLDGSTLDRLNEEIKRQIIGHRVEPQLDGGSPDLNSESLQIEELHFTMNTRIQDEIHCVEHYHQVTTSLIEYTHHTCTNLGAAFLRTHKCAPKAAYQLVIQLASLKYFGYLPPCSEAISTRAFAGGRVDIMQTVLPPIVQFCNAMSDATTNETSRLDLFHEASQAYTNTLTRVSRGRGFASHLYALYGVVEEGEEVPALFRDRNYAHTQPRMKMMTSSRPWHDVLQEVGTLASDPENVWVHYEVEDERCQISIQGPVGKTDRFFELIEAAAKEIEELLEGVEHH